MILIRVLLYNALLVGACSYAWLRGRTDERITAATCLVATVASFALVTQLRFAELEVGVLAVDLAALGVFVGVALRSERFWPLWVSGLQLTSSVTHLLKLVEPNLMPFAYSAAEAVWSYPILIILAIGTWRVKRYQQLPSAAAAG
jgi:hypothetical protein